MSDADDEPVGDARPTAVWIGAGYGLVTADALVLADAGNYELAERIWQLLEQRAGIDEILEHVSAVGLRHLRDLAIAIREGPDTRIVLRGDARAYLDHGGDPVELSAQGMRTWRELVVPGVARLTLRLAGAPTDSTVFRVASGVLPAVALAWHSDAVQFDPARDLADVDAVPAPAPYEPTSLLDAASSPFEAPTPPEALAVVANGDDDRTQATEESDAVAQPSELVAAEDAGNEYDDLYGHTVARSVQGAAVAADDPEPASTPVDTHGETRVFGEGTGLIAGVPGAPGDHDGHTVSRGSLGGGPAVASAAPAALGGPTVQALVCPHGHANPPQLAACRACGQPLAGAPVTIARPVLGRLVLSTGAVVELDRPALLGRNPRVEGRLDQEMPQLIVIDVGQALSRTHVAVRLAGWQVLIEDMGSANGTTVTAPGRPPQRLRRSEPLPLEAGSLVDLGGEVTARYDATT